MQAKVGCGFFKNSTAVSDPLIPAKHTLTRHHHISVTAVLRMIHHPNSTCSVEVLTVEKQGERG